MPNGIFLLQVVLRKIRKLLKAVANDKSLYKGTDKYGNDWHTK